ncbi:GntR family transcriptional regulator [Streptomyces asiaticus]|uniref:GntR family transcriptional regulator n=1 Tax=Streptomyces asiaticus TaxID=114695 RepID=UPI003F675A43
MITTKNEGGRIGAESVTLPIHQGLIGRKSITDQVADVLRSRILEGYFPPGTQLPEESICRALKVSRNTLREAFRLLISEGLLTHQLSRGVFVRTLSVSEVVDIFQLQILIECAVLRSCSALSYDLGAMESAIIAGENSATDGTWHDWADADMRFHLALVTSAGSPRLDKQLASAWAELRLALHPVDGLRDFYGKLRLAQNREILTALSQGDSAEAERLLYTSLTDFQTRLSNAIQLRHVASDTP